MIIEQGLYRSYEVQWYEGFPFRCIEVLKVEGDIVSFSTEWPVQKLDCYMKDFNKRFHKWN